MRKTVLVTGGTRGIGRAIAEKFNKSGYEVFICFKDNDKAALELERENIKCFKCDVTSLKQVEALKKSIGKKIDTLINNAGVSLVKLATETTEEDFDWVMDTNFKGVFNSVHTFLPDMLSSGSGEIINISSIWGETGASMESVYSASKAAVIGFSKALASEVALMGVRVNCICPGATDTDMIKSYSKAEREMIAGDSPFGIIGDSEDVASVALSLASQAFSGVTGQVIKVNYI